MGKLKNLYTSVPTAEHCGCMSVTVGALAWASSYGLACCRTSSTSTLCRLLAPIKKRPAMMTLQALSISDRLKESHSKLTGLSAPRRPSSCGFMIMSGTGALDPLVGSLSWPTCLRWNKLRLACTCLLRRFTFLVHCDLHWSMATPTNVRPVVQNKS